MESTRIGFRHARGIVVAVTMALVGALLQVPLAHAAPCPAPPDSEKRGAAYHFCGWPFVHGQTDLGAMSPGLAWYYNWSSRPLTCPDGTGVADHLGSAGVEFVPMVWGLADQGAQCENGGPCFLVDERSGGTRCPEICEAQSWSFEANGPCYNCYHQPVSREDFLADIPQETQFLLGYNEPNFKEQANLTPQTAARGWKHVEWVADQRGLKLVGPATNFCDPTPGAQHAGACIEAVDGRRMFGLAWLETFYDACTTEGPAGFDCRIDHQAVHAYSCGSVTWMVEMMKRKAGLAPPTETHCTNGKQDEDEFGVDCGGNACVACSEHARRHFSKPVWLTEFAPTADDCGDAAPADLKTRAREFLIREVSTLEEDPYVFRYAWFMPKTDIDSLDHVDLLVEETAGVRTDLGEIYLGRTCEPEGPAPVAEPPSSPPGTKTRRRKGRRTSP